MNCNNKKKHLYGSLNRKGLVIIGSDSMSSCARVRMFAIFSSRAFFCVLSYTKYPKVQPDLSSYKTEGVYKKMSR